MIKFFLFTANQMPNSCWMRLSIAHTHARTREYTCTHPPAHTSTLPMLLRLEPTLKVFSSPKFTHFKSALLEMNVTKTIQCLTQPSAIASTVPSGLLFWLVIFLLIMRQALQSSLRCFSYGVSPQSWTLVRDKIVKFIPIRERPLAVENDVTVP